MSIAEQLITRGWTQQKTVAMDGSVCLDGAICLEAGIIFDVEGYEKRINSPHVAAALSAGRQIVTDMLRKQTGIRQIANWNDTAQRTFDEVLRFAKEVDEVIDGLKAMRL